MTDSLNRAGVVLAPAQSPFGIYSPVIIQGEFAFVSGQLPRHDGKLQFHGTVGADVSVDDGKNAARLCALNCLAVLEQSLGGLGNIVQICRVTGYVASVPGFHDHAAVIDAASSVFVDMLGGRGAHSRTSIGVASLPRGAPVEIDMIVSIKRREQC